jgi:tetratricopeptide (TPR) repeat protein
MVHCRYRAVFVWTIGGVLLAGCSSFPNRSASHAGSEEPPQATVLVKSSPASPEVDQKLVDAHAHYMQGLIYDLGEQPDLAEEELVKAALADPSNWELVLELTQGYLQQKQPEKALEMLLRAIKQPAAPGAVYAQLAVTYSRLGKEDQAIEAAQTAIKRSPALMDGYRTLFFLELGKGRPAEALKVLDRAVKAPDTTPEFALELVELYAALEHQAPSEKDAITANVAAALTRASSQSTADPRTRLRLADDYNLLGDTTNAARIYLDLVDTFSETPAIRSSIRDKLSRIYWEQKNYDKAAKQLQGVVQDDPANARAYYLLGQLADEARKLPQAADYFQRTITLSEDFEDAYYDLARVQIDLDKPTEAIATLKKARAKFSPGYNAEFLTAVAYSRARDYTNSIAHFTSAEVLAKASQPSLLDGDFYFDQGAAYERSGNFDEAERCFEKSIQLSPDFAEALNYLGYMLADRGVKLDRARDLIEKAVKLEPKNPAYLDSLGWVLYKLNRSQEALPQEQKAIELTDEPDPTLFDHLGDIYAALKQTDKAREAWAKSLKLEANDAVRKKLGDAAGKSSP